MTSPSNPVNIRGDRIAPNDSEASGQASFASTPIGTPDIRALRAQYAASGTPPVHFPPRGGTPIARSGSPSVSLVQPGEANTSRPGPQPVGGITAGKKVVSAVSGSSNNGSDNLEILDLDDLPEEEKLKVLRRHLVSKSERQNRFEPGRSSDALIPPLAKTPSSKGSSTTDVSGRLQREDSEPFPIPYHAPGGDITWAYLCCQLAFKLNISIC